MWYLGRYVVLVVVLELIHEVHLTHKLLRLPPVRLDPHQNAHCFEGELHHLGGVGEPFHLLDGFLVEGGEGWDDDGSWGW